MSLAGTGMAGTGMAGTGMAGMGMPAYVSGSSLSRRCRVAAIVSRPRPFAQHIVLASRNNTTMTKGLLSVAAKMKIMVLYHSLLNYIDHT